VELRPEDRSAVTNLGTVYYYLDRMEEAIEAYRIAEKLNPADSTVKANLGDAYAKLGDLDQANEWYSKAIASADEGLARGGDRIDLGGLRVLCLAKVGRLEEASDGIETLVRDNSSDATVLYVAAQVHALAGDRRRLLEYTERAIDAGYPRDEFIRAPEFAAFRTDPVFQDLLAAGLDEP
jgi:tetratricopeptide (TPR) repeat protein